ncbi:response regulator [Tepidiphilus baoligensis]|uniref:response regulator n=1 Tax=Tepidiphilus baoligensis TaxID=2698687 RepID=UPI001F486BC3|nr:response regulator [Tepidiphilus baoligensis]
MAATDPRITGGIASTLNTLAHRTLLCIDDTPANLSLIVDVLGAVEGIKLLVATKGEQGLRIAQDRHPDAILLDLHLSDIDGYEVLNQLQSRPDTAKIPVLVISADATSQAQERAKTYPALKDYLTKPLDIEALGQALARLFVASDVPCPLPDGIARP